MKRKPTERDLRAIAYSLADEIETRAQPYMQQGMSRDRAIFHLMSSEGLSGPEARRRVDGY